MIADRDWVKRNLGFDPIHPPPKLILASGKPKTDAELQREIIDFDSEGPAGQKFFGVSTATGLSKFTNIPWPAGLAPQTAATAGGKAGGPLPKADILVVTWTMDEGHALSRVLTPGKDSHNDYLSYTHNYAEISKDMRGDCPALELKRLGCYWMTKIGTASVVVFKSDSHMSQDGPKLPNITVWQQIIKEVAPKLVITTGTAGGIGTACEVGDVIVSAEVRFDCISKFKAEPFAKGQYRSTAAKTAHFAAAETLFAANAAQLPKTNTRAPKIIVNPPGVLPGCVMTTDFFGFDTSDNHYGLQGLAAVSEMGDAVLGLVASEMGAAAPRWLAIRNVSDPQISATGLTLAQQGDLAAKIYQGFGRWSSVCSAITCWASIVAEQ